MTTICGGGLLLALELDEGVGADVLVCTETVKCVGVFEAGKEVVV